MRVKFAAGMNVNNHPGSKNVSLVKKESERTVDAEDEKRRNPISGRLLRILYTTFLDFLQYHHPLT